jgi:hypothetical protein
MAVVAATADAARRSTAVAEMWVKGAGRKPSGVAVASLTRLWIFERRMPVAKRVEVAVSPWLVRLWKRAHKGRVISLTVGIRVRAKQGWGRRGRRVEEKRRNYRSV